MKAIFIFVLYFTTVANISKRSPRWDAHLDELLSKRQTLPPGCNWQGRDESPCTLPGLTDNDALGRRTSQPSILAPVQDQGQCCSSWAFASTHVYTDTLSIMANMSITPLSPQYPTTCQKNYVNNGNGCCGGAPEAGFRFLNTSGAVTDSCAPYSLQNYTKGMRVKPPISQFCPSTCVDDTTFNPSTHLLHGYRILRPGSESEVIAALKDRTVYISIWVSPYFDQYKCGVFCEPDPNFRAIGGHALEIVDYGTENGVDFWVMKNSYGTNRGEDGYFRMRRNDGNTLAYVIPVLSSSDTISPDEDSIISALDSYSCAPTDVSNPTQDELVMSSVEHTINEINEWNSIPCSDGSPATSVALRSVTDADVQIVNGVVIEIEFLVDIMGCDTDERAEVTATVMVLENAFNTPTITFTHLVESGIPAVSGYITMILSFAFAAILL